MGQAHGLKAWTAPRLETLAIGGTEGGNGTGGESLAQPNKKLLS
jgi:hypothetical protein